VRGRYGILRTDRRAQEARKLERVEPRLSGGKSPISRQINRFDQIAQARHEPRPAPAAGPAPPLLDPARRHLGRHAVLWAGIVGIGATAYVYYNLDERASSSCPSASPA
jgi:hypothetical protein